MKKKFWVYVSDGVQLFEIVPEGYAILYISSRSLYLGSNVSSSWRKRFSNSFLRSSPIWLCVLPYAQLKVKRWAYLSSFLPVSPPLYLPPLQSLSHQISPFHSHHHPHLDLYVTPGCPFIIFLFVFFPLTFDLTVSVSLIITSLPDITSQTVLTLLSTCSKSFGGSIALQSKR